MVTQIGDYIIDKQIGKGAFATVYKGHHKTIQQEVAIKIISRRNTSFWQNEDKEIEKEISILKTLDHPNIVKFIHFEKNTLYYFLIFEFCENGDLETVINNLYNGQVPEEQAQKYIQQIIEGIKAMKARNIVHRDLKLANILVSKDFFLKIADFGLARFIEQDDPLLKTFAGTPMTMDPLIFEQNNYNEKCDIWSLGVIFYQVLTGKIPFNPGKGANIPQFVAFLKSQPPLIFPKDIPLSDSFKSLIRTMLVFDVNQRISFEDLFNHDWITGKNLVSSLPDLSASQLLQSMYFKKPLSKPPTAIAADQALKDLSEKEKQSCLCGAVFLAEAYEIFQPKVSQLKEFLNKIQNIQIPVDLIQKDKKLGIVPILLTLDMLKLLREVLTFEFKIQEKKSQDVLLLDINFNAFCEKIMQNKAALENLMGKNTAIIDLYNQAKSNYIELSDRLALQVKEMKDIFEEFEDYDHEAVLIDCLIQLSEYIGIQEFEREEEDVDRYDICYQMSEFLVFKNNFEFKFPKISVKIEELKDFDADQFFKLVAQSFNKNNNEKPSTSLALLQMSKIEEVKKKFNLIQSSILIHESQGPRSSELNKTLRGFQGLLGERINDLKGVKDIELTLNSM